MSTLVLTIIGTQYLSKDALDKREIEKIELFMTTSAEPTCPSF
jgi:hypothetical protein